MDNDEVPSTICKPSFLLDIVKSGEPGIEVAELHPRTQSTESGGIEVAKRYLQSAELYFENAVTCPHGSKNLVESSKPSVESRGKCVEPHIESVKSSFHCVSPKASTDKYYGISIPDADRETSEYCLETFVCNSLPEVMKLIKKYPKARFKEFGSLEDTQHYVSLPFNIACCLCDMQPSAEEKSSIFKSVTCQKLVELRKEIETGNETAFFDRVWFNPRYLIGDGDGPTILKEGTRYNALHVAARSKQPNLCFAILNTLNDLRFLNLLYPNDTSSMLESRRKHILDLYLNMPDKALNEIPLHFACKFGAGTIVKILLSYPYCERNKPNKYGTLPNKMICERCSAGSEDLKKQIKSMFDDTTKYVPILRDLDNVNRPVVGEICDENMVTKSISEFSVFPDSSLVCCAFAGPVTETHARNIYVAWKKKNFKELFHYTDIQVNELKSVCLSDPSKGLERVGRQLARDLDIGWLEYFKPLDDWININSKRGIKLLECHIKCHREMRDFKKFVTSLDLEEQCEALVTFMHNGLLNSICERAKEIIELKLLKTEKESSVLEFHFMMLFQDIIPHILCLTHFGFGDKRMEIHDEIGHLLYLKLSCSVDGKGLHALIMHLNSILYAVSFKSKKYVFFICILKFLCYHFINAPRDSNFRNSLNIHYMKRPQCSCTWITQDTTYPISVFYDKLLNSRKEFNITMCMNSLSIAELPASEDIIKNESDDLDSENGSDISDYFTPPESPVSSVSGEIESNCFFSPLLTNADEEMYIDGSTELSDDDIDIYRGIEKLNVQELPNLYRWKTLVESKLITFLLPETELNRTPASSSTTVKRRLIETGVITPKKLF